ncbi:MAG: T9SS type A sorting domain-containing protein [Bacteroidetes bacterium]|nr:T9SS type A sorting domain-containing protein [Bacteroidota bacterium]
MKKIYTLLVAFIFTSIIAQSQVSYGSCQTVTSGSPCFFGLYSFWIESTSFGTLNFSGGTCSGDGSDDGYQDLYSSVSGAVSAGSSYTLTIARGGTAPDCWVVAWVDWNNDGDFSDAGEQLNTPQFLANFTGGTTVVVPNVLVPASAVPGDHRMRVRTDGSDPGSSPNACQVSGSYGDTKDLKIVVSGSSNCSNVGGTASANPSTVCSGESSQILLAGSTGTIQWQTSTDGSSWSNATCGTGNTTTTYNTAALTSTSFFKAVLSEPSCPDASSNSALIVVNPSIVPTIAITANPSNVICKGEPVSFSATVTNQGSSSVYDWTVNGTSVSSTITFNPANLDSADLIKCTLTSNAPCVVNPGVSNTIAMVVNQIPDVSFSLPVSSVCKGGTLALSGGIPAGGTFSGTGVTGTNFDASQNEGDYQIVYSYSDGKCSNLAQDTVSITLCTDISSINNEGMFDVYPNPASTTVTVSTSEKVSMLLLMDLQGRVVMEQTVSHPTTQTLSFSVSELSKGIYFLKAVNGVQTFCRKLVVE